jgi:hypothetical protein
MFCDSQFSGNLNDWNIIKVEHIWGTFQNCPSLMEIPYWDIGDIDLRTKAINAYQLNNKLNKALNNNKISTQPKKI